MLFSRQMKESKCFSIDKMWQTVINIPSTNISIVNLLWSSAEVSLDLNVHIFQVKWFDYT